MACSDLLDNCFREKSRWNDSQQRSEFFPSMLQIMSMLAIQPKLGGTPHNLSRRAAMAGVIAASPAKSGEVFDG